MATPNVESLEARFEDLQRKVLGEAMTVSDYERLYSRENRHLVTDLLANTNSMMCTALSGREKIHTIEPRMAELDRYLDPTFEDSLDMSALIEVLLSLEPRFVKQCHQLEKLDKLAPILDSKEINNVPAHKDRLERLLLTNLEKQNLTKECCTRVYKLVEDYNTIIMNITKTLVQWDNILTQIELERKPKKVAE